MLRASRILASALVGSGAVLAAQPSAAQQQVGTTGAVNPAALAGSRTLQIGSNILFKERINTSSAGSVQVIFIDKTTLNIGPNSNLVIDEFVYNPGAGSGRMTLSLGKGLLRVVGGNVTHTEGATIKTPVATIGVRGGVATISHQQQGGTLAINHFGKTEVTSGQSTQTLTRPGFGTTVQGSATPPSEPSRVPPAQLVAITASLTSSPGQTGGTAAQPTEGTATSAGVGQSSAGLAPAQIQSIQSQTASQASMTMQTAMAPPPPSETATESVQSGAQQGSSGQTTQTLFQPRFYALQTTGVPYVPAGFALPGMYVSPLYGYRRGGLDQNGQPRLNSATLQAGLAINGVGAAQSSSFFVMTGGVGSAQDGTQFHSAGFRAMMRDPATDPMEGARGAADSLSGSEQFNADLIPTAFVLDNNSRHPTTGATVPGTAFFFNPNTNYSFSNAFTAIPISPTVGQVRTGQALTGYTAGIMQQRHAPSPMDNSTAIGSFLIAGTTTIQFGTDRPRVQVNMDIASVTSTDDSNQLVTANFQLGNLDPAARARGTYIDDQLFAAREGIGDPPGLDVNFPLSVVNGNVATRTYQALASSDLVQAKAALDGIAPAPVTYCVCEYTRWGFWSVDSYRANLDSSEERDRGHLIPWVAGVKSNPADIPLTGTATYNGHVVGSFRTSGTEYVAVSNIQLGANFATQTAGVTINNLDSRNYSGSIGINPVTNAIAGTITGTGSASMALDGAFFRGASDPIRDVGGQFTVTAPGYIGGGIFAGSR